MNYTYVEHACTDPRCTGNKQCPAEKEQDAAEMLRQAAKARQAFSIRYSTDTIRVETTFIPEEDPLFSHMNWVSTNGKIVVCQGMFGQWMAYRYPEWKKLRFWGFSSKETAAIAAVVAWRAKPEGRPANG
jgi:hypothetical protein